MPASRMAEMPEVSKIHASLEAQKCQCCTTITATPLQALFQLVLDGILSQDAMAQRPQSGPSDQSHATGMQLRANDYVKRCDIG